MSPRADVLVIGLAASVPILCIAAWWFQDPDLLWGLIVPFAILMAG